MIEAGKLDRRVTIKRATSTQNAYGEPIQSWTSLATVWAQYLPGGGNERFAAQQVYAEVQGRFRMYWRVVTPLDRIEYDGREYDILAVDEIGRRQGIEIKVKARGE